MSIIDSPRRTSHRDGRAGDDGFTLIEILIAIVLVGILSAVAVVGISNLVGKGSTSACQASADAAKSASAVYFAGGSAYPATFTDLTTGGALSLPPGVVVNTAAATAITTGSPLAPAAAIGLRATSGTSWIMTMTPGASGLPPTFVCT